MLASNGGSSRGGRRRFLLQSGALGTGLSLLGSFDCKPRGARIDTHQHFWTYGVENYSWIDPASAVARDFMPSDLAPQLEAAGIDGTVAVEARSQVDETEDLLAFARQASFIRGVVGWLPLVDASVSDLIDRYAENHALRGLRHAIAAEADPDFMFREDFNRGVALLHRAGRGAGLRFDLLLAPPHLGRASSFVDRHPNQLFILDHLPSPTSATA
jgi:L-fuconolactonase